MGWETDYPGQSGIDIRRAILAKLLGGSQDQMQNLGQTQMAGRVAIKNSPLGMLGPMLMGLTSYKAMQGLNDEEAAATAPWRELQAAKLAEQKQALQDSQDFRKNAPGAGSPLAGMADAAPTVANAQQMDRLQSDPVTMLKAQATQYAQMFQQTRNPQYLAAAKQAAEMAKSLQEKWGEPKVGMVNNQPVFMRYGEGGGQQQVKDVAPPPDLLTVNQGDRTTFVDKLRTQPGQQFGINPSPDSVLSSNTSMRNANLADARAREANAIAQDSKTNTRATDIRKEFNAMVPVKNYFQAQPMIQSIRDSAKVNTKAADLNMVYGTAKLLDPEGVVRESDSTMVIKTDSPVAHLMNQWNAVTGGSGLSPQAKKELLAMAESRFNAHETGYKAVRSAYESIADNLGVPKDQVFVNPAVTSAPPPAQTAKPTSNAEYSALPSGATYTAPDGSTRRKR